MTNARRRQVPSPRKDYHRGAWWHDAVVYQIYIRSFADSDGDGVGDLPGIRQRLPKLAALGVDAIWITPFYVSPMVDGGYDVADYRRIDPQFGQLRDFDDMIVTAHSLGIRVIIDIVPNHTSSEHVWFQEALAAEPGSPARDRYLFRDGRGPNGDEPPNDWPSIFGGRAWTRLRDDDGAPGQWYLHLFDPLQPDLNWENEEVREDFESILRFWLNRGVDGIRVDVAHGLIKPEGLPDMPHGYEKFPESREMSRPFFDQPSVHEIYRDWRKLLDSYPGDRIAVAEAKAKDLDREALDVRSDELHQGFNFDFSGTSWDAERFRRVIDDSLRANRAVGAPTTWCLSNHDVVRHVTRYGDGPQGLA